MQTARIFYEMMQHPPPGGPLVQIVSVGPGTAPAVVHLASSVVILRRGGKSPSTLLAKASAGRSKTQEELAVQTSAFVFEPLSSLRAPSSCAARRSPGGTERETGREPNVCDKGTHAVRARAARVPGSFPHERAPSSASSAPFVISEGAAARRRRLLGRGRTRRASSSGTGPPACCESAGPNWRGVAPARGRASAGGVMASDRTSRARVVPCSWGVASAPRRGRS